jgi:hypothetical protein
LGGLRWSKSTSQPHIYFFQIGKDETIDAEWIRKFVKHNRKAPLKTAGKADIMTKVPVGSVHTMTWVEITLGEWGT